MYVLKKYRHGFPLSHLGTKQSLYLDRLLIHVALKVSEDPWAFVQKPVHIPTGRAEAVGEIETLHIGLWQNVAGTLGSTPGKMAGPLNTLSGTSMQRRLG